MRTESASPNLKRRRISLPFGLLLLSLIALLAQPLPAFTADQKPLAQDEVATPTAPEHPEAISADWLEPQGINIVDFVGLVPDSHLKGGIVSYETGTGLLIYESGQRSGNSVTITVSVIPRYFTYGSSTFTNFGCLSQHAAWDQYPSTSPATLLTVTAGGRDVTSRVEQMAITPAGQVLPNHNPGEYLRYDKGRMSSINPGAQVSIPANKGCTLLMTGRQTEIKATFRATVPQMINVTPLGSQTFDAHSYIGTGDSGIFAPLNRQMGKFGSRHDKFSMSVPAGADFVLVNYGATPVDPYATIGNPANAGLAGSGSYRFEGNGLSVDHVSMVGQPLLGQWRDADQSGGSEFLGYMVAPRRFTTPEYFLPPGFAFDSCMTQGGCSDELLSALHGHTYPITLHYYKVERVAGSPLTRYPLKAVGKGWQGSAAMAEAMLLAGDDPALVDQQRRTFLPAIIRAQAAPVTPTPLPPAPPDDPTGCPCGWFAADGRMLDFVPAP